MTQAWNYKNFNMVYELEISGEFIYDGIQALNTMDSSSNSAELFSFLYHISVGIERLQKIILVLNEDVDSDNYEKFEKSLITHSHNGLHQRIKKYVSIAFDKRENKFLEILSTFYEKSRYGRFNFNDSIDHEKQLLEDYVRRYIIDAKHTAHDHQDIIVDLWVKEILGRVIGDISRKYYVVLHDIATRKNTFTYELRFCSKAEKIFLPNYRNESLIDMKIKEETIFKEFLLYLCNTKDEDLFLRYFRQIPPLDMDVALINDYLVSILKGVVPQSLIDEVETIYEEDDFDYKNRLRSIDPIGNDRVFFDDFD